jgi:hypothetical protein
MAVGPEVEQKPRVTEILEEMTPIEKTELGEADKIVSTPADSGNQAVNASVQPQVQPPANPAPSVQIPADPATLATASQGSADDALTWFATFWIRMVKKATHFGWNILMGRNGQ